MPISPYVRDLRAHLGTRRLLMPSVAGIVRNPENRVLLVRQQESGVWSTPGGVIEMEDSPADAVVRKVWEESPGGSNRRVGVRRARDDDYAIEFLRRRRTAPTPSANRPVASNACVVGSGVATTELVWTNSRCAVAGVEKTTGAVLNAFPWSSRSRPCSF